MNVLIINAGSSSLKYQLVEVEGNTLLAKGICERVGTNDSFYRYGLDQETLVETEIANHEQAIQLVLNSLIEGPHKALDSLQEIDAIGHRIVQGGKYFDRSVLIDDEVIERIDELSELAPLHNPPALAVIRACLAQMQGVPMVAVFDTSFFQTLEPKAYYYPLPFDLANKYSLRKYGAHGTSHRYVSARGAQVLGKPLEHLKLITCHLGNGCSMSAVKNGVAVDTSMGLTPLDGLMMGTRCGAIDPAIVPFLMEHEQLSSDGISTLMNKKSGLLGISGISNDLRPIGEAAEQGNERALLAYEMFADRVKKYIGQYWAIMGGVDAVIITAGVGENDTKMSHMIFEGLEPLGLVLDEQKNAERGGERVISAEESAVKILVVPTDEEHMIALDTYSLVKAQQS